MHEIQKHILKKLSSVDKARYGELKPRTVEGNQFVYHLRTLMRNGYVRNSGGVYSLASLGQQLVDRMSFKTFKERIQPKVVSIIALKDGNEYLFYKRNRLPFLGRVGFPYGKIHLEERILDAAHRELLEKTNLRATLKHRGVVYLTVHNETELVVHMLCHVFTGTDPEGELRSDTTFGGCFWSSMKDIPEKSLIPGVKQIIKHLERDKQFFFAEYFLNI